MSCVIPRNLKKRRLYLKLFSWGPQTRHTHRDIQTHTHTHTHDDSIRRNTMRCISPKNHQLIRMTLTLFGRYPTWDLSRRLSSAWLRCDLMNTPNTSAIAKMSIGLSRIIYHLAPSDKIWTQLVRNYYEPSSSTWSEPRTTRWRRHHHTSQHVGVVRDLGVLLWQWRNTSARSRAFVSTTCGV